MLGGSPDVTDALRAAIRGGELRLAFQPEFDLATSTVLAVEALARWQHPELGEVAPEEFVALAEQSELIHELGDWALLTALAEHAAWSARLPDLDVVLRINVAVTQLVAPGYVQHLRGALERAAVSPDRICLEITEGSPRQTLDGFADVVEGLRGLGVGVAIDDLANGYSTLSMLRAQPVDTVKIDRALVGSVDADERAATIVAAVVSLADRLGVTLVAEGIETEAERDALIRLGCRRGQGYLLSRPLSRTEIVDCLRDNGLRGA